MKKTENYDIDLMNFIRENPTPYHVIEGQEDYLKKHGYMELKETDRWSFEGNKFYVKKNDSSIIAFRLPKIDKDKIKGFNMVLSHSDSPCFKLKPKPIYTKDGKINLVNVEMYGGTMNQSWLDRQLGIGGRVLIREGDDSTGDIVSVNVILNTTVLVPSLAIHMNRDVNKGVELKVQKVIQPLFSNVSEEGDGNEALLEDIIAVLGGRIKNKESILGMDLYVFNKQDYSVWGNRGEYMSSPRLDDVQCAYSSLMGFVEADDSRNCIAVHGVFNNEEIGSETMQGAGSSFLRDSLFRINYTLGNDEEKFLRLLPGSFMISADNAHGMHPNFLEVSDPVNRPLLGRGIVLKYSNKYATDGTGEAYIKDIAMKAGVTLQTYANNSDFPGGSTLGNISSARIPVKGVDLGIAQLAMHSAYETCGSGDTEKAIKLFKRFFE